jgi:sugar lactone lactonase YvrE
VVGPDGLYITDSGFGSDASMKHVGPDRVYHVGPDRSQSVALQGDKLDAPNGIAWDAPHHRFVIVPFLGKAILGWAPNAKTTITLGTSAGQMDGVEVLDAQRILFTSWADSTLHLLENGAVTALFKDLASPADIGVDTRRNRVAIPELMLNQVQFRAIPAAAKAAS